MGGRFGRRRRWPRRRCSGGVPRPPLHADIVRVRASIQSRSGGLAEDVSATLCAEADSVAALDPMRAAYLLADAVLAFYPSWDTEPIVEIARAARAAAGDCGDPLFDYVLGYELAREGSIEEAWQLMAGVERTSSATPRVWQIQLRSCSPPRARGGAATSVRRAPSTPGRWIGSGSSGSPASSPGDRRTAGYQIDVGAWDEADFGSPRRSGWVRTRAS